MPENKMKILQRLEAGEITAEEAMAMMNQLREPGTPPPGHHHSTGPVDPRQIDPRKAHHTHDSHKAYGTYESREDYDHHRQDWVDNLVGWVGEVVEDIAGGIKDMEVSVNLSDIFSGSYGHNRRTETFTSHPVSQSLARLYLNGKNDKIEIFAYDGDCVQIHCTYDARRPDSYVQYHEENGQISLWFEDKAMRSVQVICQVPRVHIGHIHAVTKNARIHLQDITAGDIELSTKNGGILMESVSCGGLTASTRNDNIKAVAVSGENILLETTNSKITAEDIHAASLSLKTTNAGIKTANLDVTHLVIKTTNSRLKLEDTLMNLGHAFWDGERTVEAFTTNGGIKLFIPSGVGLNIEASTTDSKVVCDVPLYRAEGSSKTYLKGESMDYGMASRRLQVRLGTTNASVKVLAG